MSSEQAETVDQNSSDSTQWQLMSPPHTPLIRPMRSQTGLTSSTQAITSLSLCQSSSPTSLLQYGSSYSDGKRKTAEKRLIYLGGNSTLQCLESASTTDPDRVNVRPQLRPAPHSHFLPSPSTPRGRTAKRRCVSADVANKARSHFSSPDRFLSPRSSPLSQDSPYHSSKSPSTLGPVEKHSRERNHSQDPFRPPSASRSRQIVRQSSVFRRSNAPHFVPHFVQDNERPEIARESNGHLDIRRQVSAGGVWNVGGNTAAFSGPTPAVDNGHGGLVGSGSNAPMYIAHFLDRETPRQDTERHRSRLSLALDIDEASRILRSTRMLQVLPPMTGHNSSRYSPMIWQDGTWMRDGQTRCKLRFSCS